MEINTLEKKISAEIFVIPKTVIEVKYGDKWRDGGAETIIMILN